MPALSAVVSGNTAWQKVQKALSSASPAAQEAFRGLKIYLANQALNPNLNVAFFSQADSGAAGGTGAALGTGTPKVYGVYAKKGTTATLSFVKIGDEATGGGVAATWKIGFAVSGAGDEGLYIDYNPTAWANGIGVAAHTTFTGATVSTGAAASDGFVIYSV